MVLVGIDAGGVTSSGVFMVGSLRNSALWAVEDGKGSSSGVEKTAEDGRVVSSTQQPVYCDFGAETPDGTVLGPRSSAADTLRTVRPPTTERRGLTIGRKDAVERAVLETYRTDGLADGVGAGGQAALFLARQRYFHAAHHPAGSYHHRHRQTHI